jgi:hypothetical protein
MRGRSVPNEALLADSAPGGRLLSLLGATKTRSSPFCAAARRVARHRHTLQLACAALTASGGALPDTKPPCRLAAVLQVGTPASPAHRVAAHGLNAAGWRAGARCVRREV